MEIAKVIITTLFSVVTLFIITKLMGHKQVAQLDFFDYISGITIGSIGAELATELEAPLKPFTSLSIYCLVSVLLSKLTHKFPKSRKYINGTPTIIMNNGKLYRENMKKAKLDLSEFLLLCREQGYFDLSEIQTAIFEHNGTLSILPVSDKRPITPFDMNITPEPAHIGTELIMDGRIMGENLTRLGRNESWLKTRLKAQDCKSERDIFFGVYFAENDELSLYKYDNMPR